MMSIVLKDAMARLTVPQLKDLASYLPGAEAAGCKDQLIERILVHMLGPRLNEIWSRLDETQQAAVGEAVHHPLFIRRILEHLGLWAPLATERSPPPAAASWPRDVSLPLTYHPVPDIA